MADTYTTWSWSAATGALIPGNVASKAYGARLATAVVAYENKWGLSRYPALPTDGSFNSTTLSALADVMRDILTSPTRFPAASVDVTNTAQAYAPAAAMPAVPAHVGDIANFIAGYISLVEKYANTNMSISVDIPPPSPTVTITKISPDVPSAPPPSPPPATFPWKGVGIAAGVVMAVGIVGLVAWKA